MATVIKKAIDMLKGRLEVSCHPADRIILSRALQALEDGERISNRFDTLKTSIRQHLDKEQYAYKGFKVYEINDCDYWCTNADQLNAALEHMAFTGTSIEENGGEAPAPLSMGELLNLTFIDVDADTIRTFLDELHRAVDVGEPNKGFFFASSEF